MVTVMADPGLMPRRGGTSPPKGCAGRAPSMQGRAEIERGLRWGLSSLDKPGFALRNSAVNGDVGFFEVDTKHQLKIGMTIAFNQRSRHGKITRLQAYQPCPTPAAPVSSVARPGWRGARGAGSSGWSLTLGTRLARPPDGRNRPEARVPGRSGYGRNAPSAGVPDPSSERVCSTRAGLVSFEFHTGLRPTRPSALAT